MAGQKQGRSGTGRPGSGQQSSRQQKSGKQSSGGRQSSAGQSGSGSRQGSPRGGGSSGTTAAGVNGSAASLSGRPGQPDRSAGSPGGRPGQPDRGRQRPGQSRADLLARDNGPPGAAVLRPAAPRWLQLTTLVLSLAGVAVSIYLTIAHYTSSTVLLCPANSFVNCGAVTTSSESIIFGIFPVAVLGLAFYVFMVAITTPWAWRAQLPAIRWARLGAVIAGIVFVLYLVYAELIEIGKICEYCTIVHIITFILFVLIVFNATAPSGAASAAARR
jgi:uncharacterized membrane protein